MESSLVYFPYKEQKYLSILFYAIALELALCFLLIPITHWIRGILLFLCIVLIALARKMWCISYLRAEINSEGITLTNKKASFCAKWESFTAIYSMGDLKGHTFLLFAKNSMNKIEKKKVMQRMFAIKGNEPNLNVDGNIYIKVDRYKDKILMLAQKGD